jgi:hypothetical protein
MERSVVETLGRLEERPMDEGDPPDQTLDDVMPHSLFLSDTGPYAATAFASHPSSPVMRSR